MDIKTLKLAGTLRQRGYEYFNSIGEITEKYQTHIKKAILTDKRLKEEIDPVEEGNTSDTLAMAIIFEILGKNTKRQEIVSINGKEYTIWHVGIIARFGNKRKQYYMYNKFLVDEYFGLNIQYF